MNTNLLRSWLDLPPGPWPPDDRTLLGLGSASVSPAGAERRALVLMAKLRPHQLVHPELVTEGMNRLAQALLAVSMSGPSLSVSRPSSMEDLPLLDLVPPPPPAALLGASFEQVDLQAVVIDARPPAVSPPAIEPEPMEIAEATVARPAAAPPPPPVKPRPPKPAGPIVLVPDAKEIELPEPHVGPLPADRRDAYRRLAGLRALTRAWDRLRPFYGDPSESIPTAGHVFDYLEATHDFRQAWRRPDVDSKAVFHRAPRTVAVAHAALSLAVFRSLTPPQRLALAQDWARSRAWLEATADSLRSAVRKSAATRSSDSFRGFMRILGENPEWMLAAGAALVFCLAGVRVILRPS